MELLDVNTTAAREHAGEIERGVRYLKERCRCSVNTFASANIKYLVKPIVICLVYNVTALVNTVLDALDVSEQYSLCKIVTQRKLTLNGTENFNSVRMYRRAMKLSALIPCIYVRIGALH